MRRTGKSLALAGGAAALAAAYTFAVRPWHTRWGTTADEVARAMPLDAEVVHPNQVTNRAITISATPEQIWPWLAQMGELPRGGFYTYTSVERLLGMHVKNAEEIIPEQQWIELGDHLDHDGNLVVKALECNRYLVLGPPPGVPSSDVTWAIELVPLTPSTTRLISRIRARIRPNLRAGLWFLILDPGQFLMERKWLLGVKERSEHFARIAAAQHHSAAPAPA